MASSKRNCRSLKIPKCVTCSNRLAFDVGGSLIKVVQFTPSQEEDEPDHIQGTLQLSTFEFPQIDLFINQTRLFVGNDNKPTVLPCTGLGFRGHKDKLQAGFDEHIVLKHDMDEANCNAAGVQFLFDNFSKDDVFYQDTVDEQMKNDDCTLTFPYMLVTAGSGVSFTKVDAGNSTKMVGATNRGGRTLMGLSRVILGPKKFNEIIEMMENGDHRNVNWLLKDGYGGELDGYPGDSVCAYFGKATEDQQKSGEDFKKEDLAATVLEFVMDDISQLISLHAALYKLEKIVIAGSLTEVPLVRKLLRTKIFMYSEMKSVPLFIKQGGHVGAIGAWLKTETS